MQMEESLPPLRNFILPVRCWLLCAIVVRCHCALCSFSLQSGGLSSSSLHVCRCAGCVVAPSCRSLAHGVTRAVCRRAERSVVPLVCCVVVFAVNAIAMDGAGGQRRCRRGD